MTDPYRRLAVARLYLVAPGEIHGKPTADWIPELVQAGVDVVQLREKNMEAGDLLHVGRPLFSACYEAGIPFIVNDRADVAAALQADGVHFGQNDLPVAVGRRFLPGRIVGRSTHSRDEIDMETGGSDLADYIAVGPLYETPTKPGRQAVGLDLATYAAGRVGLPWFAIGGIDASNLPEVMAAGARRIVVVRAITEADDPPHAAAQLRELLDSVALP